MKRQFKCLILPQPTLARWLGLHESQKNWTFLEHISDSYIIKLYTIEEMGKRA